jgi:hypothetical protein
MRTYGSGVGVAVGSGVFVGGSVGAGELLGSGSGVAWFEGHPGMLHAPILTNSNPSRKAILNLSTTMYYNPGVFGCQLYRQLLLIVVNVVQKLFVDRVQGSTPHSCVDLLINRTGGAVLLAQPANGISVRFYKSRK